MDYRKLTSSELINMINDVSGCIIEEDKLKGQSKWDLVKIHKAMVDSTEVEKVVQTEQDVDINRLESELTVEPKEPPSYYSQEWSDYVMSKFNKSELVKDKDGKENPTLPGLRRIGQELLGPIIVSEPIDVKCSLDDKPGKAVVTYKLVLDWQNSGRPVQFGAVASSWIGNTDDTYAVFTEAMAESRAEGRTWRKALGIRSVCADELTNKDTTEIIEKFKEKMFENDGGLINDIQVKMISVLTDRLNIDLNKLLESQSCSDLSKIQYSKAVTIIKLLNKWQGSNSIETPKELLKE